MNRDTELRGRDFITLLDFERKDIDSILDLATDLKRRMRTPERDMPVLLDRKTLFMLFYNMSLRTRNSFEVAMTHLGGNAHFLQPGAIYAPALKGEEKAYTTERISDVARVLSEMGEGIAIRLYGKHTGWEYGKGDLILREFTRWASIPVINMEDDVYHPCQALADLLTMRERGGRLEGKKFVMSWAYSGSPEKPLAVPQSAIIGASFYGMDITLAHPKGFELDPAIIERVKENVGKYGGSFAVANDMDEAFEGADFVYPKCWTAARYLPPNKTPGDWDAIERLFDQNKQWITNQGRMDLTNNAWYMHCLPADRDQEVTDEIIDGPRSVVWEEAGNRLHTEKALLAMLL